MSATDWLENKLAGHVSNVTPWTPPSTFYLVLFTSAPNDAGVGTEPTIGVNAYGRVSITNSAATWTVSGNQMINNIAIPTAAPDPAAWGTITHAGLADASTGGNIVATGALQTPIATEIGVPINFAPGALVLTFD
jgi:hypothetical protein